MLDASFLLKSYAKWRKNQLINCSAAEVQRAQLLKLLRQATHTRFGREHSFSGLKSVAAFQKQVPLRSYEDFWRQFWQPQFPRLDNCTWPGLIPCFAVSSGTTSGTTKYIPITTEMNRSNVKAGIDLLVHHVLNRPNSRIMGGKSFMLGGSTALVELAPGILSGDLSGIAVKYLPWWAKRRYFPPADLALLSDWEKKVAILAERARHEDIRMLSGVPSWLLIFIKQLFAISGARRLPEVFPRLEMLVHGGVPFGPYQQQFADYLSGSGTETREVYPASEGFIAVADRGYGEGLRLLLDHGIFFEFVPLSELDSANPIRHWVQDIELDTNYAVVMSTCAGLWSYLIGDTVRFIEKDPPRLLVTGRTAYYLSAFGEHLIAEEIEDALSCGAAAIGRSVVDFSVGPLFPTDSEPLGGHLYMVEFAGSPVDPKESEQFLTRLDQRLCERNEDYAAHRAGDFGLRPPTLLAAHPGCFAAWMKSRGKLGGQNKVPRIITNEELLADLQLFTKKYRNCSLSVGR